MCQVIHGYYMRSKSILIHCNRNRQQWDMLLAMFGLQLVLSVQKSHAAWKIQELDVDRGSMENVSPLLVLGHLKGA